MNRPSCSPGSLILRVLIGMALATTAFAADGVVEINQARALAGGVSNGDAPGFPVTISESGSYMLTGNLEVDDANTTAIEITRYSVDLDLNGFVIKGPVTCTLGFDFAVTSCSGSAQGEDGWGIEIRELGITVHDGSIFGMGAGGVYVAGPGNTIRNLTVTTTGGFGIRTASSDTTTLVVENRVIQRNREVGIFAGTVAVIRNNVVTLNGSLGIIAQTSTIVDNHVILNGHDGINHSGPGLIRGQ